MVILRNCFRVDRAGCTKEGSAGEGARSRDESAQDLPLPEPVSTGTSLTLILWGGGQIDHETQN